jgi:hypothetical protein
MKLPLPKICGLDARTKEEKEAVKQNDKATSLELKALRRRKGNTKCADCSSTNPGWAALPHGICICIDCAQVHRGLGRHISQVKGISSGTYLWYPDEVQAVATMGNTRANALYLASCPQSERPNPKAGRDVIAQHIKDKYVGLQWITDMAIRNNAKLLAQDDGEDVLLSPPPPAMPATHQSDVVTDDGMSAWDTLTNAPLSPPPQGPVVDMPAAETGLKWGDSSISSSSTTRGKAHTGRRGRKTSSPNRAKQLSVDDEASVFDLMSSDNTACAGATLLPFPSANATTIVPVVSELPTTVRVEKAAAPVTQAVASKPALDLFGDSEAFFRSYGLARINGA